MPLILCNTLQQISNLKYNKLLHTGKIINNHYEVLNLSRNCTTKEIKESFIKLSKEHHPDLNKSKDAHTKFLQINEAYNVLSKQESRRLYDLNFSMSRTHSGVTNVEGYYKEQSGSDPWKDPFFYNNRDKSQDKHYEAKSYYGVKGLQKVSNLTIVLFCFSVTIFVVALQIFAIRNSVTFRREELIRRSNEAQDSLKQLRETALSNGNHAQIELLKQKFSSVNSVKYRDEK